MSFRESAIAILEAMQERPLEALTEDLKDIYPNATPADARRIKKGLLKVLTADTQEDLDRLGKEYKALHAELRKKYGNGGSI